MSDDSYMNPGIPVSIRIALFVILGLVFVVSRFKVSYPLWLLAFVLPLLVCPPVKRVFRDFGQYDPSVVPRLADVPFMQPNITRTQIRQQLGASLIGICRSKWIYAGVCACKRFTKMRIIANDSYAAYAVISVDNKNKLVVVTYRASLHLYNWVTNSDYVLIPHPDHKGVRVHRGFYNHMASLHPQLTAAAKKYLLRHPGYTLHITGYSLGGAAASVSIPSWMAWIGSSGVPIRFFLYASPRTGDSAFANLCASYRVPITRLSLHNDPFHHVPAYSLGYVHVGQEFYEPKSPHVMIKCRTDYEEDRDCAFNYGEHMSIIGHLSPHHHLIRLPPFC
ncbi:hypothetical protein DSO57_1013699 [Entomophthora muscae]|uniref:Uncharacterized protein n=1 Tax=Entomophthora muscae TaxID=34485 RepID=A0ACC2TG77_9FUNG|nr:hypothetical protein DSO57_1013699 [Entomophthora muscae]